MSGGAEAPRGLKPALQVRCGLGGTLVSIAGREEYGMKVMLVRLLLEALRRLEEKEEAERV